MKLASFVKELIVFFIFIFFYFLIAVPFFYFTKLPSLIVYSIAITVAILIAMLVENQLAWLLLKIRMKKFADEQK